MTVERQNKIQGHVLLPSLIELTGRDRVKWLHSFVTNEIRNLTTDSWQETFVTDSKGKSFSHGCAIVSSDSVFYLSVSAGQEPELMAMWDRYIISEDVTMRDASKDWVWFYTPVSNVEQLLLLLKIESQEGLRTEGQVQRWTTSESPLSVVAIHGFALTNDFVLFGIPKDLYDNHSEDFDLTDESVTRGLAAQAFFPWFGIDFSKENLPQEADRDSLAISFKKGCYLGQETIARLDALGQVQKKLYAVNVTGAGDTQVPTQLLCVGSEGEEPAQAGTLTSAYPTLHPTSDKVGFAMIRRKYFNKINELSTNDGARLQPRFKSL